MNAAAFWLTEEETSRQLGFGPGKQLKEILNKIYTYVNISYLHPNSKHDFTLCVKYKSIQKYKVVGFKVQTVLFIYMNW